MAPQSHPKGHLLADNNRLRITLDSIGDAVITTDIGGCIVDMNPAAETLTGWNQDQAQGKPLSEVFNIVNAQTGEPVSNPVARVLQTGKIVGLANHTQLIAKDGREYQIADSAAPIRDANGQTQGVVLVFRDVTDEYKMQKALRQSEERFRVAQEMSPDGFTILHPERNEKGEIVDFSWVYENQTVARINSTDPEKVIGERLLDLFPNHRGTPVFKAYLDVANTEKIQVLEEVYAGEILSRPTWLRLVVVSMGEDIAILTQDITEQVQAADALRQSEEKYRSLFNQSTEGIYVHDLQGRILDVNDMACAQTGYSREDLLQRTVFDLHPAKSQLNLPKEETLQIWREWTPGQRYRIQGEHLREDRTVYPVEISTGVVRYNNDHAVLAIVKDISERVQREARIEHLNQVLRAIRDVNQLITHEEDRDTLLWRACDILTSTRGYSSAWAALRGEDGRAQMAAECGIGEDFAPFRKAMARGDWPTCFQQASANPDNIAVIHAPDQNCKSCSLSRFYRNSAALAGALRYGRRDFGVLVVALPVSLADDPEEKSLFRELIGDIAYALYAMEIAQERRQALQALRASQERLDLALSIKHEGIWDWDLTTNQVDYDDRYFTMAGYEPGEFPNSLEEFQNRVHPEDLDRVMETAEKYLSGQIPAFQVEFRFRHKNNSWIWIQGNGKIFAYTENGEPKRFIGTHMDITQRKQAVQRLRESEDKYRNLFETMSEGVVYQDADGKIVSANPAAERILGLSLAQLQGKTSTDPRWKAINAQGEELPGEQHPAMIALRSGNRVENFLQGIYIPERDEYVWILVNSIPQFTKGNHTPHQVYSTFLDITERVQAEDALRRSEERFRRAINEAPFPAMIHAEDGEVLLINRRWTQVTGYPQDEISTLGAWTERAYGERQGAVREVIDALYEAQGYTDEGDFEITCRDGSTRIWSFRSMPLGPDETGRRVVLSMAVDITDRVRIESQLKVEKEWSESLIDNAPNIVVGLGERSKIAVFNRFAERLTGYQAEEVLGEEWIGMFVPEEQRDAIYDVWDEIVDNQLIDHHFENEIITRSGERRLIDWRNTIITENGAFQMILSLGVDITDRVQAEAALRESEEKYRTLVNSSLQGVVIAQSDPIRLVFANPAMAQISGYPPERLLEMTQEDLAKLIHSEDRQRFFGSFQKRLQGEDIPEASEYRLVTKAGAVKWVTLYSSRIEYQNEPATLTTFMDITERKDAEENLRQLKDQLQEEVAQKTRELQERVEILERFHDATIKRELRMKELREEIARLKGETG